MSHDPFHDLFDSEIPRPASAASTRSTLDTLAPQFHRAKARRRARVSAVAAFAVLGTTGGAAALGVGPVAYNNGPLNHHSPVASSSSVVENPVESTTTTTEPVAEDTTTTVTVTTTTPTTIPDLSVEVADPAADGVDTPEDHSADVGAEPDTSHSGNDSDTGDAGSSDSPSSDSSSEPSTEPSHDSSKSSDTESDASLPVAGPLTKSIDEGSATVDIGPNGLVIVDITPATGMGFEVESKPDSIDIQFHDLVSGDKASALEFDLVEGGISVKVDHPPH